MIFEQQVVLGVQLLAALNNREDMGCGLAATFLCTPLVKAHETHFEENE